MANSPKAISQHSPFSPYLLSTHNRSTAPKATTNQILDITQNVLHTPDPNYFSSFISHYSPTALAHSALATSPPPYSWGAGCLPQTHSQSLTAIRSFLKTLVK